MNKYYKIKIDFGNGKYKWIGSGHGMLYPTAEKFALYFTSETLQSSEVQFILRDYKYELVEVNENPHKEWLIYTP